MTNYNAVNLSINIMPPDKNHKYQIIEFIGEFDKTGLSSIKEEIDNLVQNFSEELLIFDLSKLNYINSESIGFLMSIHTHLTKTGKNFALINATANVKDIFDVIGLLQVINHYDSLQSLLDKSGK